jgi:hypothetical protein
MVRAPECWLSIGVPCIQDCGKRPGNRQTNMGSISLWEGEIEILRLLNRKLGDGILNSVFPGNQQKTMVITTLEPTIGSL